VNGGERVAGVPRRWGVGIAGPALLGAVKRPCRKGDCPAGGRDERRSVPCRDQLNPSHNCRVLRKSAVRAIGSKEEA